MSHIILSHVQEDYEIYQIPSIYNGYQLLNQEKITTVVAYFHYYVQALNEKKLCSLMWFADRLYYQRHGRSITGLAYEFTVKGVAPVAFTELGDACQHLGVSYKQFMPGQIHQVHYTAHELACLDEIALQFEQADEKEIYGAVCDVVFHSKIPIEKYLPYAI